jgi:hypothetical protein
MTGELWESASLIILNIKSHKQFFEIFYYLFIDQSGISHYLFHLFHLFSMDKVNRCVNEYWINCFFFLNLRQDTFAYSNHSLNQTVPCVHLVPGPYRTQIG